MKAIDLAKHSHKFIEGFNNAIMCFTVIKETTKMRKQAESDEDCDFKDGWITACDELEQES